jgi:hypothetical protein
MAWIIRKSSQLCKETIKTLLKIFLWRIGHAIIIFHQMDNVFYLFKNARKSPQIAGKGGIRLLLGD